MRSAPQLPPAGSALSLPLPPPHPIPKVSSYQAASGALGQEAAQAAAADGGGGAALVRCLEAAAAAGGGGGGVTGPLELRVELSVVMPHPGDVRTREGVWSGLAELGLVWFGRAGSGLGGCMRSG